MRHQGRKKYHHGRTCHQDRKCFINIKVEKHLIEVENVIKIENATWPT